MSGSEGTRARGHEGTKAQNAASPNQVGGRVPLSRALVPSCPRALVPSCPRALLGSLLLASSLLAASPPSDPTASEFALHIPLKVSGQNGVVQFPLPLEVYLASRNGGLADLRVYNGAGQWLPYALHYPMRNAQSALREQAATLFPVYRAPPTPGATAGLDLQLRTGPDGALLSVQAPSPTAAATGRQLAALIVDLGPSARHERLESLAFTPAEAGPDYRARVSIERSDDLEWWDGIALGHLDWIASADASAQLVNDRIDLGAGHGRYLRISWLEGEPQVFAAVVARWRGTTTATDPVLEVALDAQTARVDGDFAYATSPAIAASAIGLDLPEANTVFAVSIGNYRELRSPQPKLQFVAQFSSTFYRLNHRGGERVSSRLHLPPLAFSEWIVRPHEAGHAAPKLVLQWRPQTLVFNARGQDFVLAVGADPQVVRDWRGGPSPLAAVAPGFSEVEIATLETAVAGPALPTPATVAAPPPPPTEDAESASRQRRYALWSVLGLGILLLGWMTWRLYEQMVEGRRD